MELIDKLMRKIKPGKRRASRPERDAASMRHTDHNATREASTTQTARDAAADQAGKPVEHGGES